MNFFLKFGRISHFFTLCLTVLCLLSGVNVVHAQDDTSAITVSITSPAPMPRVMAVNDTLYVGLHASLDRQPQPTDECTSGSPRSWSGTSYSWSGVTFVDSSGTTTTPTGPDARAKLSFSQAGDQSATISVSSTTTSSCGTRRGSGSKQITIRAVSAGFNTSLIKTGYTQLGGGLTPAVYKTVTMTVSPATERDYVTPQITGAAASHAEIRNITPAGSGTITFQVWGTSASTIQGGDSGVVARHSNISKDLATAKVVTIIPAAIGTPHPQIITSVTGYNRLLDRNTSPAISDAPAGIVVPVTTYTYFLKVPVVDQFGIRLDPIYAGVRVTEEGGTPINQTMASDGTYLDPVGPFAFMTDPATGGPVTYTPGSPEALAWASKPLLPIIVGSATQNISVEIGGHSLNPAVVGRIVSSDAPNTVGVRW